MKKPDSRFYACILAGGSGERFWPMSRAAAPKQLLKLFSDRTLLEDAVRRLDGVVLQENIFVLTNKSQAAGVRSALPFLDPAQIIAEPAKRDTGPAAALATGYVRSRDEEGILALFPADALIKDSGKFRTQIAQAFQWAKPESGFEGTLFTFAIPPSYPATGFGYLQMGQELSKGSDGSSLRKVVRFVEKPDQDKADAYVADGHHAWNAGMFIWPVRIMLKEANRAAPELAAFARNFPCGDPTSYLKAHFQDLPKISIDYALMEKAGSVATILAQFDWDDVGSWTALEKHFPKDSDGNTFRGPVTALDASGNIVVSTGRHIALCGVKDLIVVETADAVLICRRESMHDIRKLHPRLPSELH